MSEPFLFSTFARNALLFFLAFPDEFFSTRPVGSVESVTGLGTRRIDPQQEIVLYQPIQRLAGLLQLHVNPLLEQAPPGYTFPRVDRLRISQKIAQDFIRQTGQRLLIRLPRPLCHYRLDRQ